MLLIKKKNNNNIEKHFYTEGRHPNTSLKDS